MKDTKYNAFTLIELMVVITILGIISLATYMPYAHHQKKTLVKQSMKEMSQTLSESRNLAIHWLDTWSGNVYVGIDLTPWANQINYYTSTWWLNLFDVSNVYKTKNLPTWVEILSINGDVSNTVKMTFTAITGSGIVDWASGDTLEIITAYKWSSSNTLQKTLTYYIKSYISDY